MRISSLFRASLSVFTASLLFSCVTSCKTSSKETGPKGAAPLAGTVSSPAKASSGTDSGSGSDKSTRAAKPAESPVLSSRKEPPSAPKAQREETPPPPPPATNESPDTRGTLLSSTKRSAAGLPDPITGYPSWFRLEKEERASGAASASQPPPHLPVRQAYMNFPKQEDVKPGTKLSPPLLVGTTLVLEEKATGGDFIGKVNVMTKEESGWKYFQYSRSSSPQAFQPVAAATSECGACHSKAQETDCVYSKLLIE